MIYRQHHSIRCVGCVPGLQKGPLPLVQHGSERRRYGFVRAGRASFLVLAGEGQGMMNFNQLLRYRLVYDIERYVVDLDELLQEDLKRMAAKESNFAQNDVDDSTKGSSLKDTVDKILIADFFFVLFALGWFGAGVGIKSSSGDSVCHVSMLSWL